MIIPIFAFTKVCTECRERFSIFDGKFYLRANHASYRSSCKDCHINYHKKYKHYTDLKYVNKDNWNFKNYKEFNQAVQRLPPKKSTQVLNRKDYTKPYQPDNIYWDCRNRNSITNTITYEIVYRIRKLSSSGYSIRAISTILNLTENHVGDIVNNKYWRIYEKEDSS